MNKEYNVRDIKYGLVAIDPTQEGDMKTVLHFCGYIEQPGENELRSLMNELKTNKTFGLTEIADRLDFLAAPDDLIEEYVRQLTAHEQNNNS